MSKYHGTVPSEKHWKEDHSFIERLYNDFGGYHAVDMGINELGYRVAAGLAPERPLTYLRKIIESAPWDNKIHHESMPRYSLKSGDNSNGLKQRLAEKEKKYADIYLS